MEARTSDRLYKKISHDQRYKFAYLISDLEITQFPSMSKYKIYNYYFNIAYLIDSFVLYKTTTVSIYSMCIDPVFNKQL